MRYSPDRILAEVDGISPARQTFDHHVITAVDAGWRFFVHHWLAVINIGVLIFAGLPVLAPVLLAAGYSRLALAIYTTYQVVCHQIPSRSFFLFGSEATYTRDQLLALGAATTRDFLGNDTLGFKMAYCERDAAIYASVAVAGLLFALVRHRLRPPKLRLYGLIIAPMAIDGFTQLFGLRESTWDLRVATGILFGVASVWLVYPHFERTMARARETLARNEAVAVGMPIEEAAHRNAETGTSPSLPGAGDDADHSASGGPS